MASKYDKERKKLGLITSSSLSSTSSSNSNSKYASERESIFKGTPSEEDVGERYSSQMKSAPDLLNPFKVQDNINQQFSYRPPTLPTISEAPMRQTNNRPLTQLPKANEILKSFEDPNRPISRMDWVQQEVAKDPQILQPISTVLRLAQAYTPIGGVQRGAASTVPSHPEIDHKAGLPPAFNPGKGDDIAQMVGAVTGSLMHVRGAGIRPVADPLTVGRNVSQKLSQLTPKLSSPIARRTVEGVVAGGVAGAVESAALGKTDLKDMVENSLYGAATGGILDGGGAVIGQLGRNARQSAQEVVSGQLGMANAIESTRRPTASSTIKVNENPMLSNIEPPTIELSLSNEAQRGLRANYQNQLKNGNLSPELQQQIRSTDQSYPKIKNDDSVTIANDRIKDIPKAEAEFIANESLGADHIATGYRLMQQLDSMGEHQRALNVANKLASDLTKTGQTMQASSLLARLSPEGQLLNLTRTAVRNGKEVTVADKVKFQELAAVVQENTGAGVRGNQIDDILNRLEKGDTVSPDELKTLGNMLERANKFTRTTKEVKDIFPKELKDVKKREKIVSFLDNAERDALARIAARKNRLNSLPVGEWADHTIVVASQLVKETIKAATYVEDMVKLFGNEIRPYAADIFEKAQKMVNQSSKRISEGKLNEANQIVNRLSGRKVPTSEKVMEKYINENPVSEGDIKKLRELAKQVNELSGDDAINADMAMQKILNSYEKSSAWDKVQALRYIAMLLNTSTQAVNAMSGPIMATTGTVADLFGTMIDITLSKALKQPRTTTLYGTNPLGFIAKWIKGAKIGGKAGWHGVNPAGIAGPNEIRGLTFKGYNPLSIAERSLGTVAKGADYGTYKAVQLSEMRKIAYLDAKNKGIKGKANIDKHITQFINEPPDEAILQADRIGKNTTFQRSDTLGGSVANSIAGLSGKAKLAKPFIGAIMPFVRTPINIASTAITISPGGIIKGLFQLTSKSDASRREAIRTLSLGLTGTGLLSPLGYYLSEIGVITGANDSGNKNIDAIHEQAGQGKYRFNTSALERYLKAMIEGKGPEASAKAARYQEGDKQFDYNKLQPIAFPAAIGAALNDRKDSNLPSKIGGAMSDAAGSFFGMSTLKGVQDIFQPQYGGTTGEKTIGLVDRLTTSFLKSFSPSLLAQEARRLDPIQRKTSYNDGVLKDTGSYFKSRLPVLSESLPPRKTTLGQDKLNAPGITGQYLNPYKSEVAPYTKAAEIVSQLIKSTGDESLAPSAPLAYVEGKDRTGKSVTIDIPKDRYLKYQEELGNDIINLISEISSDLPDDKKAENVKDIYKTMKERHRNKIKREQGIVVE